MSEILRSLCEDAVFLKNSIVGARAAGVLTTRDTEHALTACARIIQVLNDLSPGAAILDYATPPISEFIRWPNAQMPCPKCDGTKPKFLDYTPRTKFDPERMKHSCRCGYYIFTKPADASPNRERDPWDEDETESFMLRRADA